MQLVLWLVSTVYHPGWEFWLDVVASVIADEYAKGIPRADRWHFINILCLEYSSLKTKAVFFPWLILKLFIFKKVTFC